MATEFSVYQIKKEINVESLPWVEEFKNSRLVFEERRPLLLFYEILNTLFQRHRGGDDYVEIFPEDYHLLKEYVDLSKYEDGEYKFVCCII